MSDSAATEPEGGASPPYRASPETPEVAPYREITTASLVLGIVVGIALTISFTYAGLKLGFIVPASMVSAMLGLGVLRTLMKKGSIVENNINQTVAAAINVSSGGVIFTVPVLYLMQSEAAAKSEKILNLAKESGKTVDDYIKANPGLVQTIDTKMLIAIAGAATAGALLGVFFIIPSRKQMIDLERLPFPSGIATAAILKASGSGPTRFRWLITGISVSIVFALLTSLQVLFPQVKFPEWYQHYSEDFNIGELVHLPAYFAVIIAVAGGLTSLGGGYITGRAGLVLMVGAIIGHWVVTPLVVTQGWLPHEKAVELSAKAVRAVGDAGSAAVMAKEQALLGTWAYKQVTRPLGIGMLLGGSIASIILTAPMLLSALKSIQKARQIGNTGVSAPTGGAQEMNPKLLYAGVAVSFVILTIAGFLGGADVSPIRVVLAALIATVWMWLANIIVSIATGKTDNSPLSGMALMRSC
ncbi:MAG: OPT/YSL family transporter [Polyangiaceae bacterium]